MRMVGLIGGLNVLINHMVDGIWEFWEFWELREAKESGCVSGD